MSTKYTQETPYKPVAKYHMSLGNVKIGKVLNTNLIAGDDYINGRTTLKGSCSGCCGSCKSVCYARAAYRYDRVIVANADNTYFAETDIDGYFSAIEKAIESKPSFKLHRFHSSGEILSPSYFEKMVLLARKTPNKTHYVYTKRYSWVNDYVAKNGNKSVIPANLSILFSPPFTCDTKEKLDEWAKKNNPYGFPMFIYDNGKDDEIKSLPHCQAVSKKGHKTGVTCDKCRRCPSGMTTAVYAH